MTPRQKRIIAILAIANIAVILALVVFVTRPFSTSTSTLLLSNPPTPTPQQQTCQWRATQLLAQTGLGGTVTLSPEGLLRFEITCLLSPAQTADEVAQLVWTAFDAALALYEQEKDCATFVRVEIAIQARGNQGHTQIDASVRMADLVAFNQGQLNEDQFIERVSYRTTTSRGK